MRSDYLKGTYFGRNNFGEFGEFADEIRQNQYQPKLNILLTR